MVKNIQFNICKWQSAVESEFFGGDKSGKLIPNNEFNYTFDSYSENKFELNNDDWLFI